jgi:xylulokinase
VPYYLGLDSSTQSLTALVIEIEGDARRVVLESSIDFDADLPHHGTMHGVLASEDPAVAVAPPLMWAEALDVMLGRLSASGLDTKRLVAIAGSGQQHGSVYLNARASGVLGSLDPSRPLVDQLATILARPTSPIWMDSSTAAQCAEIASAVGGSDALARHTGSRAFERFTGPQIRKVFQRDRDVYDATDRIHLVSSFLASLLIGAHAPLDTGDASGMNLMDLATGTWWSRALDATAPGLARKLPPIVPAWTPVGTLSPYWQTRHGLPAARVYAWSGDNPCSLIGTGLVAQGSLAVSLGTSDTVFGPMDEPRLDATGAGHVFGAPTGRFMGLTCFRNGSLARERIRDMFGLTWEAFSDLLAATPPGNHGRLLLPWFEPEITPPVLTPGVHRISMAADDAAANVRGVVEGQQMAMAIHSRWIAPGVDRVHATGGASVNRAILQVMADVFGADVYQFAATNAAALGAALRAVHAHQVESGRVAGWPDVLRGLAEPLTTTRIRPDPERHAVYQRLMPLYLSAEASAHGAPPSPVSSP